MNSSSVDTKKLFPGNLIVIGIRNLELFIYSGFSLFINPIKIDCYQRNFLNMNYYTTYADNSLVYYYNQTCHKNK